MLPGRSHLAALCLVYLSLGGVLGTLSSTIYARLNATMNIDIPNIQLTDGDAVKWTKSESELIAKSKLEQDVKVAGFTIFKNGSLQVSKFSEPKRNFTVEVHDKSGKLRKTCSFTLIGIEPLSEPTIHYTCKESVEFSCSVARGQPETLVVHIDRIKAAEAKSAMSVTGRVVIQMGRNISVKCVAENKVSRESKEEIILCPTELDILLFACIAGAVVIFIIFVVLMIYCVLRFYEQRCRKQASEEEVELPSMTVPREARQRQLPEPRDQPTRPPHHPQPQPRHHPQQQRKRPQHKSSSHQKMREDQLMMHCQAMSQQNTQQGHSVSQPTRMQGQARSQHNRMQGQAVSQSNRLLDQAAVHQEMVQGQPISQQNRQQAQPAAQQRRLQRQPVPQHMVQVYPASPQQKAAQEQLPPPLNQVPQLPPHHPSSVSQGTIPRPLPHAQPRASSHSAAELQHYA